MNNVFSLHGNSFHLNDAANLYVTLDNLTEVVIRANNPGLLNKIKKQISILQDLFLQMEVRIEDVKCGFFHTRFINSEFFVEYVKSEYAQKYDLTKLPFSCINWEEVARQEASENFRCVLVEGVKYYYFKEA